MKKISSLFAVLFFLISCGGEEKSETKREVNNKKAEKHTIQNENNDTGDWRIANYLDVFDEKTDRKYLELGPIKGVSSTLAYNDYDLNVMIKADTDHVEIKLFENGSKSPVELVQNVTFKVKESNGDIHDVRTYKGLTFPKMVDVDDSFFRAILSRGGKIKFSTSHSLYGDKKIYRFTIPNADSFKNAINEIVRE